MSAISINLNSLSKGGNDGAYEFFASNPHPDSSTICLEKL